MTKTSGVEDQILAALRRITRAIDLHSQTLLRDCGLTAPQLTALNAISRLQPITAGEFAKEIHLGHPTVTGILDRLDRRGLIQRMRGEADRRNVSISLTDEGRAVLKEAPSLLQEQFHDRLGQLAIWERSQILATLQHIADMMDATEIEPTTLLLGSEIGNAMAGHTPTHLEQPNSSDPADSPGKLTSQSSFSAIVQGDNVVDELGT